MVSSDDQFSDLDTEGTTPLILLFIRAGVYKIFPRHASICTQTESANQKVSTLQPHQYTSIHTNTAIIDRDCDDVLKQNLPPRCVQLYTECETKGTQQHSKHTASSHTWKSWIERKEGHACTHVRACTHTHTHTHTHTLLMGGHLESLFFFWKWDASSGIPVKWPQFRMA